MATTQRVMAPDGSGSFKEVASDPLCTLEMSMNAKGQLQYDVKLYFRFEDRCNAPSMIKEMTDRLNELYGARLAGGQ